MARVHAYHTTTPEHGAHHGVYHLHDDCPSGKRIKAEHRTSGTGGHRLCEECAELAHSHAYHTSTAEHGSHHDVYHLYEDCPDGRRITPEHRVAGTGRGRLCDKCAEM